MNARVCLLLLASCSLARAETWELPPVIDNSSYPATTTVNAPATNTNNNVYELIARIEQLQKEVQALTGKVEEQAFLLNELKKQQKVMYSDFDDRLQSIESKNTTPPPADTPSAPVVPEPRVEEPPATDNPPAPAKKPEAKPPAPPVSKNTPVKAPVSASANNSAVPASAQAVAKPVPPPAPADYQNALTALRTGHTTQAISAFSDFLQNNPNSEYADNAQYWLGEAYRINNDSDSARKAFRALIEQAPKSDKVADALLKLGIIELDQKNTDKARDYFNRIRSNYPNSSAAVLAAKKLDSLP